MSPCRPPARAQRPLAACDGQAPLRRPALCLPRHAGGRGWGLWGVGPGSGGSCPPVPSLPLAVRGPAHLAPPYCCGLRRWLPLLPALPPPPCAVPREREGLVLAGAAGGGLGQRSVVRGQRVRGTPLRCTSMPPAPSSRAHLVLGGGDRYAFVPLF